MKLFYGFLFAFAQYCAADKMVDCSSLGYAHNECAVDSSFNDIKVTTKYSRSPCVKDVSFGIHPGYIWVDKGCRARFELTVKNVPKTKRETTTQTTTTKKHWSPNSYAYQVIFSDADMYDYFHFDVDFPNDVHIGFSSMNRHEDMELEIVLGGWSGGQSVIRPSNQGTNVALIRHTKSAFNEWKKDFTVAVRDGEVVVSNEHSVLMSWYDVSIKKSELKNLFVSGGWGASGNWVIQGTNEPKQLKGANTKEHFSRNSYAYEVVYSDAEKYDVFHFDADFPNDVHIGFSSKPGHHDKKLEIVLGGWAGKKSVIRHGNQRNNVAELKHTIAEFNKWKKDFTIIFRDGEVVVSNADRVLMSWYDVSIKKSELKYLLVSGGWGGTGDWVIQGVKIPHSTTTTTHISSPTQSSTEASTTKPEFTPTSAKIQTGLQCTRPVPWTTKKRHKIVGGLVANRRTYPWQVRLTLDGKSQCSGSIIHDRWVLTAAHCCINKNEVTVFVGDWDQGSNSGSNKDLGEFSVIAQDIIMHNRFPAGNGKAAGNDICLLKVPSLENAAPDDCTDSEINGNRCYAAACLPSSPPVHGEACHVSGWGTTKEGGGVSRLLREVGVNLFSNTYCKAHSKSDFKNRFYGGNEVCAGTPDKDGDGLIDSGKDSCQELIYNS